MPEAYSGYSLLAAGIPRPRRHIHHHSRVLVGHRMDGMSPVTKLAKILAGIVSVLNATIVQSRRQIMFYMK